MLFNFIFDVILLKVEGNEMLLILRKHLWIGSLKLKINEQNMLLIYSLSLIHFDWTLTFSFGDSQSRFYQQLKGPFNTYL